MSRLVHAYPVPNRGLLRLSGADRVSFLQGLVSNDVRRLSPDQALWAALLTAQGKFLHDMILAADGDSIVIDTEGGDRLADLARRLKIFKLRAQVTIEALVGETVALVWGDDALARLDLPGPGATRRVGSILVVADPRAAALGLRLIGPAAAIAAWLEQEEIPAADLADWDRRRLGLGIPDGSRDLVVDKTILLEAGFDRWDGVAWDKGCWVGQELTARTKYRGLLKKRLFPVRFDGEAPPHGTAVLNADGTEAGELRSAAGDRALALLRLEAVEAGGLTADGRAVMVEG